MYLVAPVVFVHLRSTAFLPLLQPLSFSLPKVAPFMSPSFLSFLRALSSTLMFEPTGLVVLRSFMGVVLPPVLSSVSLTDTSLRFPSLSVKVTLKVPVFPPLIALLRFVSPTGSTVMSESLVFPVGVTLASSLSLSAVRGVLVFPFFCTDG